jgi:hypothetical protein
LHTVGCARAIVEYKLHLSDIVNDFETDRKNLADINLTIAWDNDYTDINPNYLTVDIQYTPDHDKVFPHVNQSINELNSGKFMQFLILKDFVEGLNS